MTWWRPPGVGPCSVLMRCRRARPTGRSPPPFPARRRAGALRLAPPPSAPPAAGPGTASITAVSRASTAAVTGLFEVTRGCRARFASAILPAWPGPGPGLSCPPPVLGRLRPALAFLGSGAGLRPRGPRLTTRLAVGLHIAIAGRHGLRVRVGRRDPPQVRLEQARCACWSCRRACRRHRLVRSAATVSPPSPGPTCSALRRGWPPVSRASYTLGWSRAWVFPETRAQQCGSHR